MTSTFQQHKVLTYEIYRYTDILDMIKRHGHEARFIGEVVRDFSIGRPINEVEIITTMLPEDIESLCLLRDTNIQITTIKTNQWTECSNKRDFTINSIQLSYKRFYGVSLFDCQNGLQDITDKIIRFVGNPFKKIEEDGVYILKAFTLMSQLNFTIENDSLEACINLKHKLKITLSELIKLFNGKNAFETIRLLNKTKILEEILPIKLKYFPEYPFPENMPRSLFLLAALLRNGSYDFDIMSFLKDKWKMSNKSLGSLQILIDENKDFKEILLLYDLPTTKLYIEMLLFAGSITWNTYLDYVDFLAKYKTTTFQLKAEDLMVSGFDGKTT